jgi:hypothetical protein
LAAFALSGAFDKENAIKALTLVSHAPACLRMAYRHGRLGPAG